MEHHHTNSMPKRASLLGLPPELRQDIYHFALVDHSVEVSRIRRAACNDLALLQISSVIRREAHPLFFWRQRDLITLHHHEGQGFSQGGLVAKGTFEARQHAYLGKKGIEPQNELTMAMEQLLHPFNHPLRVDPAECTRLFMKGSLLRVLLSTAKNRVTTELTSEP